MVKQAAGTRRRSVLVVCATWLALVLPPAHALTAASISLNASPNTAAYGQPVTLSAMVSPPAATGKVTFFDGVSILGIAAVSNGAVTLNTRLLAPGAHLLRAIYSGDGSYPAARSSAVTVTVRPVAQFGFAWTGANAAHTNPASLAVGDFNGDGHPDIAAANYGSGDISVLIGNGDGTFRTAAPYATGQNPSAIVASDFNGDGKTDLAVANAGANSISVLLGNGDGTFQPAATYATSSTPCSLTAADFNNDGIADLAVANCGSANISVFLGAANGTFAAGVTYAAGNVPTFVAAGDFNDDGNADLAVANAADGTVAILSGKGDGTFNAPATYATNNYPLALAVADFNADGKPDIAATGANNVAVLINTGSGSFGAASSYTAGSEPYSVLAGDLNGDGAVDLVFGDSAANAVTMLAGNGDGTFQTSATGTWLAGSVPSFLATADFNGDGIPDLAVADEGGGISILSGNGPPVMTMNCIVPQTPLVLNASGWSAPCSITNGQPQYSWSVTSGSLPSGLFLSATTGATVVVKGTPIAAGPYSFTVTATDSSTPAGQAASWIFSGTITQAVWITSLTPSTATAGSTALTLTVAGSGFERGATVKWNGTALSTSFVSATQLNASVTASLLAAAGSASVTVANPDGGVSAAVTFTISAATSGGSGGGVGSSGGGGGGSGGGGGVPSGGGGGGGGGGAPSGSSAITLSATSLSFNWTRGDGMPAPQTLAIFAGIGTVAYTITVQTDSGTGWLHVSSTSGKTPTIVTVSIDQTLLGSMGTQTYAGQIFVSGPAGGLKIPVSLTIQTPAAPSVTVAPATMLLAGVKGGTPSAGQITILNSGGGTAPYFAAVTSGSTWLRIAGAASGSATNSTPGVVAFAADPSATAAGILTGSIAVTASGKVSNVAITFVVNGGSNGIALSQSAISFSGSGQQSVTVSASAAGAINWTAQASASWLKVSPASGQASATNPALVAIGANAAGMQPGAYYGLVAFTSPDAANGYAAVTVVMNIGGAASNSSAPASTGITLMSAAPQQISVADMSGSATGFTSTASTLDGNAWLSVTPALGVPKNGSAPITVTANPATSGPGPHQGLIAIGFDDGVMQTIPVTLIAGGSSCAPSTLLITSAAITGGPAQAGMPQTLQLSAMDDCGNPPSPSNTNVQATFSNGDPAVSLFYSGTSGTSGVWQGGWIPANTASQMQVQITAAQGALKPATAKLPFTVAQAPSTGPGSAAAIVNAASGTGAQTVAPGSYIAIYGTQLAASGYGLATATPFPTTLDGTQVFLGGQPLPLYYSSPTQINALVPQNLAPNTIAQLVIQRDSTVSIPVPVLITPYQPAIYAQNQTGAGQGSIEISGTALLAAPASANSRPAQRGTDYIAIYCTGLGPVKGQNGEAPPPDGAAASYPPLYNIVAPVTVTIGGVSAPVAFAGLTPTLVNLYQVDAQVPAGAPTSDAVPVVISITDPATSAVVQSNTVSIAVQ